LGLSFSAQIVAICWKAPQERTHFYCAIVVVQRIKVCFSKLFLFADSDRFADTASKTISTSTKAASFPSLLRQKRSDIQTVERSDMQNEAMTRETCVKCGNEEVRFTAVQLRSADEGSTIFYTCDCGYK